ncbi:hypothetical protein STEG23_011159 [Scotinomys teguina]
MARKAGQGEEEEVAQSQEAKREDASPPWREEDVGVTGLRKKKDVSNFKDLCAYIVPTKNSTQELLSKKREQKAF